MTNGAIPELAVFLDRDGVINRRRLDHVKSWTEFEFLPGVLDALAELHRMEVRVVVVTNQAVVGRGVIRQEDLGSIHERMTDAVVDAGGQIERIYSCPHAPEAGCPCRKPATALFAQASEEMGITLEGSILVGDTESDVQAAKAVGCLPILVGEPDATAARPGVAVVGSLLEVVPLVPRLWVRQEVAPC